MAKESDLVFTKASRVLVPLIGMGLGLGFEHSTNLIHNLNVSSQAGNLVVFFFAFIGLAGTITAGVLAMASGMKGVGLNRETWISTLRYLQMTITTSLLGLLPTAAILVSDKDINLLIDFAAAIAGAVLFSWSCALFAVITCAEILFERSAGPQPSNNKVISGRTSEALKPLVGAEETSEMANSD